MRHHATLLVQIYLSVAKTLTNFVVFLTEAIMPTGLPQAFV